MMKRIFIFALCVMLIVPFACISVFAASEIDISCDATVMAGDNFTVTASIDTNGYDVIGADFYIEFDSSQLSYVSSKCLVSGWEYSESVKSDGKVYFLCNYTGKAIEGDTKLMQITLKADADLAKGESVRISISSPRVTTDSFEEFEARKQSCYVTLDRKSSVCTLSSLSVDGVTLEPSFSPSVTEYKASFDYRTDPLTINASVTDSKSKVKIYGNESFKEGENKIRLTVTAEDGTTKDYIINATMGKKPYIPSSDCYISNIELSTGTLDVDFYHRTYTYTVYVEHDTEQITLTPTPRNDKATCEEKTVELDGDEVSVKLVCTAEDGSQKTYTFNIVKVPEETNGETTAEPETEEPDTEQTQPEDTSDITLDNTTDGESSDAPSEDTAQSTDNDDVTDNSEESIPAEDESVQSTLGGADTTDTTDTTDTRADVVTGINKPIPLWVALVCSVVSLILGAAISAIIFKRKF